MSSKSSQSSIALKKQQYSVEIRKQRFNLILQKSKENAFLQNQVNSSFKNYLKSKNRKIVPQICVENFSSLDHQLLDIFIEQVESSSIMFDFSKPQNISFFTKIMLIKQYTNEFIFKEINKSSFKIWTTLKANQTILQSLKQDSSKYGIPKNQLYKDILLLPNSLLQFWGTYSFLRQKGLQIKDLCIIFNCFINWFNQESIDYFNYINMYSLCYFMDQIQKGQSLYFTESFQPLFKSVEEIFIKYKICRLKLLIKLIENNYFSEQLLQLIHSILKEKSPNTLNALFGENKNINILLKIIIRGIKCQDYFNPQNRAEDDKFGKGINNLSDNDNLEFQITEIHSTNNQKIEKNLKNKQKISIQQTISKNQKVYQKMSKIKNLSLNIFHQLILLSGQEKIQIFFSQLFQQILQKLVNQYLYAQNIYEYCQIQKSISVIFTNLIVIISNLLYQESNSWDQSVQPDQIIRDNCQFQFQQISYEQKQQVIKRFRQFLSRKINIVKFIQKTAFKHFDKIVDFIQFLKQMCQFIDQKQLYTQIFEQANIVQKVHQSLCCQQNSFNQKQQTLILKALVSFIIFSQQKSYSFHNILHQVYFLSQLPFSDILDESQYLLIKNLIKQIQRSNQQEVII